LPQEIRRHGATYSASGTLPTVNWTALARSLESSYATREEEINHKGSSVTHASMNESAAVTFF
jgi:hypothetical protein